MARHVPRPVIAAGVLVLLLVAGGIFLLIALLTGDKTKNQEHSAPASTSSVVAAHAGHPHAGHPTSGGSAGR